MVVTPTWARAAAISCEAGTDSGEDGWPVASSEVRAARAKAIPPMMDLIEALAKLSMAASLPWNLVGKAAEVAGGVPSDFRLTRTRRGGSRFGQHAWHRNRLAARDG